MLGPRPELDERSSYVPRAGQEWFIVTGLARAVPGALSRWGPSGGGRVLDVGCGRQPFRGMLEGMGLAYEGLDTQQNADGTVAHVCAIDGDLPAGLSAGSFDLVLCTEVLEHVADWGRAWGNIAGLMRPGGRAVVTCPFVYPLHEEPYDFWRATPHALAYWSGRSGLRVVESSRVGGGLEALGTALASVRVRSCGGIGGMATAAALQAWRRVGLWALKRGWVRGVVEGRGGLYVSNLVVLEKPA